MVFKGPTNQSEKWPALQSTGTLGSLCCKLTINIKQNNKIDKRINQLNVFNFTETKIRRCLLLYEIINGIKSVSLSTREFNCIIR